jgi:hypothetical protein
MFTEDDYQYAIENTRVILAPEQRIQTFGSTSFRFHLITELMDSVNHVRVRDGRIHAEKPQILAPSNLSRILLDGFGEQAREFAGWLEHHAADRAFLKYGFQFRKSDVVENVLHEPLEKVISRVRQTVEREEDPLSAIIHGVDDAWEVCLLKFAVDMIQQSAGGNLGDFRRRGLL